MARHAWIGLVLLLVAAPLSAQRKQQTKQADEEEAEHVPTPAAPYARWLTTRTVAGHAPIEAVEIAVVRDGVCRTVASTHAEDMGETCDADENGPMKTGKPSVEAPSSDDPVYDVTQALHDAQGNLIGAVGMDIEPGAMTRDAVLRLARSALQEIEARIPSKERLFGPAPRG